MMRASAVFASLLIGGAIGAPMAAFAQSPPVVVRPLAASTFVLERPLPELLPFTSAPARDTVLMAAPTNRAKLEEVNLAVEKWSIPGNTLYQLDPGTSRLLQLIAGEVHVIVDGVDTWVKAGDTVVIRQAEKAAIQTGDDTAVFDVTTLSTSSATGLNR